MTSPTKAQSTVYAYPNEHNPPFTGIPAALIEKHLNQVFANLETQGIRVVGESEDGALILDLRQLAVANGSVENGQRALYAALDSLHIAAVTLNAADVQYILGNDMISHGLARAVESGLLNSADLLTLIAPSEIITNLRRLEGSMVNDRSTDPAMEAHYRAAAVADFVHYGYMTSEEAAEYDRQNAVPTSDAWASMRDLPRSPNEYLEHQPWKSPFDVEGY